MKKNLLSLLILLLMQTPFGCNKSNNDSFEKKINSVQSEFEMAINKAIQQRIENENPAQTVKDNLTKTRRQVELLKGQTGKSTFNARVEKVIAEAKGSIPSELIASPISRLNKIKEVNNSNEQANELSLISDEIDEIENSPDTKTKTEIIAKNFLKKNITLLDEENIFKGVIDSNENKEKILSTTTTEFTGYLEKNINKATELMEQSKNLFKPEELPKITNAVKNINESYQNLKSVFKKDTPLKDLSVEDKKKTEEKVLKIKDETEKYAKQIAKQIKDDEEKLKRTTDPQERERLEKKIQFMKILLTILGTILFAIGAYLMATGNVAGGVAAVTLAISLLTGGDFNSGGGSGVNEGGQEETGGGGGGTDTGNDSSGTTMVVDSLGSNSNDTSGTGDCMGVGDNPSLIQAIIAQDSSEVNDDKPTSTKKIKMLPGEDWDVKFDFQDYWDFTNKNTSKVFKVKIPEDYRVICGASLESGYAFGIMENGVAFKSKLSSGATDDAAYNGCSLKFINHLNGCRASDEECCKQYEEQSKSNSEGNTPNEDVFNPKSKSLSEDPNQDPKEQNPTLKKGQRDIYTNLEANNELDISERRSIRQGTENIDEPKLRKVDYYFSPGSDNNSYVLGVQPKNEAVAFIVYKDNKAVYWTPRDYKVKDVLKGQILNEQPKLNKLCVIEIGNPSYITGIDINGYLYKIPIFPIPSNANFSYDTSITGKLSSREPCK